MRGERTKDLNTQVEILNRRIEQAQKEGNDDSDVRVLEKFVQGY